MRLGDRLGGPIVGDRDSSWPHSGEVEIQDGQVAGIAVHIAARVMALAGDSQVLVSGTVKDLVVGSPIQFADRGSHQLRGIPGEWRLFEVTGLS